VKEEMSLLDSWKPKNIELSVEPSVVNVRASDSIRFPPESNTDMLAPGP